MRNVSLGLGVLLGALLAGCQHPPEYVAIQNQYVGADHSVYGRNPVASTTGNVVLGMRGQPQARCAVVRYDPYGRPYCEAVKYIR
jgi:hypothetical protein